MEPAEQLGGGEAQEEEVEGGGVRREGLICEDELLDEMPMRRWETKSSYKDSPRSSGFAHGEMGSNGEALDEVGMGMRSGGEEQEERDEEAGEVGVGCKQGEREEQVQRAEEGNEGERREGTWAGRSEERGGETAREGIVGRRVGAGRRVVRERPGRSGGRDGTVRNLRCAAAAAPVPVWRGGGGGSATRAGGADVREGGSRGG